MAALPPEAAVGLLLVLRAAYDPKRTFTFVAVDPY